MGEALTAPASSFLAGAVPPPKPNRRASAARGPADGRLASTVLAHLPLGVAVIDADARLLFWNEHAAGLFGVPPMMAAERPLLADILAGMAALTQQQRDGIVSFGELHIAAGDRTEPESCLRISLGRERRVSIQIRGIGFARWMMAIDDGRMPVAAARNGPGKGGGVAWLDALTGLSNRRHFNQVLRELADGAPAGTRHALLMIDLDRFKPVNETLGRPAGDALLCLAAQRLTRETRDDDLLARLGGDEFAVLIANGEQAEAVGTRLVDVLSRPFVVEGHTVHISASIGIARFPEHAASADDLVRYAELALYDAKSAGRRTWRVFEPAMAAEAQARRDLETGLRRALAMGELSLAYRPRWSGQPAVLTGFEALPRWNHPVLGDVSPVLFIPVAEEIGRNVSLDAWTLTTACKEAAGWPAHLSVTVSIPPHQLEDGERLLGKVEAALEASGLAAERLELKIAESSLLSSAVHVVELLPRLRASGVRIAMEEFGAEPSREGQLRSFPFNKIKVDQRLVAGLGDDDAAAEIRAIVALGAGLGMTSIGEGAQPVDEAVPDGGGEMPGRPIEAGEIEGFLRRHVSAGSIVTAG